MSGANTSVVHATVMVSTLICLTVLAMNDKLLPGVAGAIFSGIAGVVFGAGASTIAANGAARSVVDAAIERGGIIQTSPASPPKRARRG